MKTNWNHPQFSIHDKLCVNGMITTKNDKLCVNGMITTKKSLKNWGCHNLAGYAS